ncbi:hypothetical protein EW146_g9704 [Bondarzewia mesenterica]|uniref:Uncharacterized protein n=1 Tax=Bondarzewia mesenterica TaxID=1095465 RepID=A0A4S4L5Y1_9AGAM|nr:hypothetical protein EW146_g9704 [Bondarzewia mesenterica]
MHFTYIIALCSLFLFSAVVAAPVPEADASLIVTLDRRTVTPTFTFTGDLATLNIPSPGANPSKKDINKIKKLQIAQAKRVELQRATSTRAAAVLSAASNSLNLSGNLAVTVINNFHTSPSDSEAHATFKFSAPICGGTCTGHAYETADQPGKIFNAAFAKIFG